MTTDIQTIALNKLFHSEANVRRTGKADGIEGLAASIVAHGLRQNLNVAPREDGMPGSPGYLFAWCLPQPQETLLDLLAFVAALTVYAVHMKGTNRHPAADSLAQAVALDMRDWWQPTVDGFWQRLPKAGMMHALGEARVTTPAPLDNLKKAEAAQILATAMQDGDWLPVPLRTPSQQEVAGRQLAQAG